jgi:hypothetical protein
MRSCAARGLALFFALAAPGLRAQAEELTICYNYGCSARAPARYAPAALRPLQLRLAAATDAAAEREAISVVIGRMYAIAGEQTPIRRDRGGNYDDGGINGKMDCIDHSTNTSAFLGLLQARGWLRFHEVLEPVMRRRFLFAEHRAARVREQRTQAEYVVDSWFFDNGHPAAVLPAADWFAGKTPDAR